jgi:competence protein ComEC
VLAWPSRGPAAEATHSDRVAILREWLGVQIAAEAGPGRLLPWIPVAFGAGVATYFAADREPVAWVATTLGTLLIAAAFLLRRRRGFAVLALVAAAAAGFAIAALKTARVAHGVLGGPVYVSSIKGFVETHEERERTDRFVLRVTEMETPRSIPALSRVRLSVKKGTAPAVGSFVELKARLLPPLQPLRPGSYDFARDMYFQGIGASGFVMGAIQIRDPPGNGGLGLRYAAMMQNLRDAIDARIRSVVTGDARAIATALLTGRRDAISTPVNDALFVSGLGHVLSISGYHMAVVAGIVFFAVRALLALVPALTSAHPIKKWAALAALAAATFYLLLSGAEVATQRSFVMTAVVLIAIMVDRRAITFRTLAIAAMAVLLVTPETIVHPSFQMSFAATLGLVALVSAGMPRLFATPDQSATARAALWGGRELTMLALASLVAGLATTPYTAFHFHRVTPYGVFANLAAMPVVSALVMPAGILGLVAMPFGLDGVFWRIMELGIGWMIAVAQAVAALPGAVGRIAAFGTGPMVLSSMGLIVLGLLRTPMRWAGAMLLAVAVVWALGVSRPDVLIAGDGANIAVRGADGRLRVMRATKDSFQVREWLAADADWRPASDPSLQDGVSCDGDGCVAPLAGGGLVALALTPAALADDCGQAALVVTSRPPPADCAAVAITSDVLKRSGALALRRTREGFAIEANTPEGGTRPWSPALSDAAFRARTPLAPNVDATPAEADQRPDD